MPKELRAKLLYPDPMKPAGLRYELPKPAIVTIEIFDACGALVKTVFSAQPMDAGCKVLEFCGPGLQEGNYSIRIVALVGSIEHRMTKKIAITESAAY